MDRHMFTPAADYARVEPLFRSKKCEGMTVPKGYGTSLDDFRNPLTKNECESEESSLTDDEYISNSNCAAISAGDAGLQNAKECLAFLVGKSDRLCEVHKSYIYSNHTIMNTTLGIMAAGAGAAGAMMPHVVAANALAGAAGFASGAQALMSEEVYKNYISEAIIRQINKNREDYHKQILKGVVTGNLNGKYQIKQAAENYHALCSFYAGLVSLVDQDSRSKLNGSKAIIEKQIQNLRKQIAELDSQRKNGQLPSHLQKKYDSYTSELEVLERFLGIMFNADTDSNAGSTSKGNSGG